MAQYDRDFLTAKHRDYDKNLELWGFHLRSFLGGDNYRQGYFLNRYVLESDEEFIK